MKLRRLLISVLAAWAVLAQTTAFAWSVHSILPHKIGDAQSQMAPSCHDHMAHGQDQSGAHHCCCGDQCSCDDFCSSAAVPVDIAALDDLLVAHFEALQSEPDAVLSRVHLRFRPPISNPS